MSDSGPQTGRIDLDKLEEKALDFRPQMIICGGSAYPREWQYKRLREIADKVGAYLFCDMAHIRCNPFLFGLGCESARLA